MIAIYENKRALVFLVGPDGLLQLVKEIDFLSGSDPQQFKLTTLRLSGDSASTCYRSHLEKHYELSYIDGKRDSLNFMHIFIS